MSKKLLLVTSFGTTHRETCDQNIGAVERHLTGAFPGYEIRRAFTSGMVRRALSKAGVEVDDVPAALQKAREENFVEVILLPTHLLYGDEYEKLCRQASAYEGAFVRLQIAGPLLASTGDLYAIADTLLEAFPARDTALVLMGHGTAHHVNPVYGALQTVFRLKGQNHVFVGTVEAWPALDDVVVQLKESKYKSVMVTPLMLVAGDHAVNDMAGEGNDSWKSILERQGFSVQVTLRGLGEYENVRKMYERHVREAMA